MTCFMCKGDLEPKVKTYVATLDNCVIIVKNVPALVCNQCGEAYYSDEVAERLENIVDTMEKLVKDVAIVEYSQTVA